MLTRDQFQTLYNQGPEAILTVFERQDDTILVLEEAVITLRSQVKVVQARLDKDSHNSSKPPSSDGLAKKPAPASLRQNSSHKPGGQKGHCGYTLTRSEAPDATLVLTPTACVHCGNAL